jgi:hypothetical protein
MLGGRRQGSKGIYYSEIIKIKGTVQLVLAREKLPKNSVIFYCLYFTKCGDAFKSSI